MTFANTPRPPYVAVIFTSQQTVDLEGYDETSARMEELAAAQPGYLGIESARDTAGFGITVSYWTDEQAARDWKAWPNTRRRRNAVGASGTPRIGCGSRRSSATTRREAN